MLSNDFTYLEPLMGPIDKERYIKMFSEFNVREAVPDLDYQFQVRVREISGLRKVSSPIFVCNFISIALSSTIELQD